MNEHAGQFFPPTHKRVGLNKSMFGAKFSKKNERAGSLFRVIRVLTYNVESDVKKVRQIFKSCVDLF